MLDCTQLDELECVETVVNMLDCTQLDELECVETVVDMASALWCEEVEDQRKQDEDEAKQKDVSLIGNSWELSQLLCGVCR